MGLHGNHSHLHTSHNFDASKPVEQGLSAASAIAFESWQSASRSSKRARGHLLQLPHASGSQHDSCALGFRSRTTLLDQQSRSQVLSRGVLIEKSPDSRVDSLTGMWFTSPPGNAVNRWQCVSKDITCLTRGRPCIEGKGVQVESRPLGNWAHLVPLLREAHRPCALSHCLSGAGSLTLHVTRIASGS